jgi:uncharacterized protein
MKYLLVLIVVVIGLWMLNKRLRGPAAKPPPGRGPGATRPQVPAEMVECAHCGLHLPAADAVRDGAHVYCGDAHRRLGPRADAP